MLYGHITHGIPCIWLWYNLRSELRGIWLRCRWHPDLGAHGTIMEISQFPLYTLCKKEQFSLFLQAWDHLQELGRWWVGRGRWGTKLPAAWDRGWLGLCWLAKRWRSLSGPCGARLPCLVTMLGSHSTGTGPPPGKHESLSKLKIECLLTFWLQKINIRRVIVLLSHSVVTGF